MKKQAWFSFLFLLTLPLVLYPPFTQLVIYRPMSLFHADSHPVPVNEFGALGLPWRGEKVKGLTIGTCNLTQGPIEAKWSQIFSFYLNTSVQLNGYSMMGNDLLTEAVILRNIHRHFDFVIVEIINDTTSMPPISAFRTSTESLSFYYPPAWGEYGYSLLRDFLWKDQTFCRLSSLCTDRHSPPIHFSFYSKMNLVFRSNPFPDLLPPYALLIQEAKRISDHVVFLFLSMPNIKPIPTDQMVWMQKEAEKAGIETIHFHPHGNRSGRTFISYNEQKELAEMIGERMKQRWQASFTLLP